MFLHLNARCQALGVIVGITWIRAWISGAGVELAVTKWTVAPCRARRPRVRDDGCAARGISAAAKGGYSGFAPAKRAHELPADRMRMKPASTIRRGPQASMPRPGAVVVLRGRRSPGGGHQRLRRDAELRASASPGHPLGRTGRMRP